jgi:hypothetical protein
MTTTENTGVQKIIFLVSILAIAGFLYLKPEWFWVVLPFFFTSFVRSKNWI